MKTGTILLVLALLSVTASCAPTPSPDQQMTAMARHLGTVEPPQGWTLTRYAVRSGDMVVSAHVDSLARVRTMSLTEEQIRSYYAAPCPAAGDRIWRTHFRGKDILIDVNLSGRRRFTVSCRAAP